MKPSVLLAAVLVATFVGCASASCWYSYQWVSSGPKTAVGFYLTSPRFKSDAMYIQNYTVQSYNDDTYYLRRGDRVYETALFDEDYYTFSKVTYNTNLPHSASVTRSASWTYYFPVVQLHCDNFSDKCQIIVDLCINYLNTKTGEIEEVDDAELAVEELYVKE